MRTLEFAERLAARLQELGSHVCVENPRTDGATRLMVDLPGGNGSFVVTVEKSQLPKSGGSDVIDFPRL